MRHKISKDLYDYWNSLRGARAAPDRNDVDPSAIRHVLADSFIIEVDPACLFPIRLCGGRLNALWASEQKGRSFLDLWSANDQRNVAAALLTTIDGVIPIVAGAAARAAKSDRNIDFELLLLPLRYFGKTHSRLLGSLASFDQSNWSSCAIAAPLSLNSMRVIQAPEMEPARLRAPTVNAPGAAARQKPKLVVYEGGKLSL